MGHLEGNFTPVQYIWDARFLKVNVDVSFSGTFYFVSTFTPVSPHLPYSCFSRTNHDFSHGQVKSAMQEWHNEYSLGNITVGKLTNNTDNSFRIWYFLGLSRNSPTLQSSEFHFHVHNNLLQLPNPSHKNPLHNHPPHISEPRSNIKIPFFRSSPPKFCMRLSFLPYVLHVGSSHPPVFNSPNNVW